MTNLERDTILYISEGVRIITHHELGLILILKQGCSDRAVERALSTTNTRIIGPKAYYNGYEYYPLEEI